MRTKATIELLQSSHAALVMYCQDLHIALEAIDAQLESANDEVLSITARLEAAEKEVDSMIDQMNFDTELLAKQAAQIEALKSEVVWAMNHIGMDKHTNGFIRHVLSVGGMGDYDDCSTYIKAAREVKS